MIILAINFILVSGQPKTRDSLRSILSSETLNDLTRIRVLLELAEKYTDVHPDTTLLICKEATLVVGSRKPPPCYVAALLRVQGSVFVTKGKYDSAKLFMKQAIVKINGGEDRASKRELGKDLNGLGSVLESLGTYDSALHCYKAALKIFEELGDTIQIINTWSNMGMTHEFVTNYPLAIQYHLKALGAATATHPNYPKLLYNTARMHFFKKEFAQAKKKLHQALQLYQKNDNNRVYEGYTSSNLGIVYSVTEMPDSALLYLRHALRLHLKIGNQDALGEIHYAFAFHFKNQKDWNNVLSEAKILMELAGRRNSAYGRAHAFYLMSEANDKMGRRNQAILDAKKGLALAKEVNTKFVQRGLLQLLSDCYASQKNFPLAYSYSQQLIAITDSINNEEKIRQVANMEALYENDKKEKEIAVVRAEKLTADAQLNEQQTRSTLLIVGLSLVSLLLATGIFFYIALRKNRKTLELKNAELLKLNQTKDRFFAIVGHDLRGPITSFSGINDLLNWYISKNDIEQLKSFGGKITQSVRQLDTLLNNLLNWAMSQTDVVPYKPEPLQLSQLTKECYGYFQHSLEVKQITLTDDTSDELFVFADKNALATVLRNLVSNAIKFTPANGTIKISAKTEGNFVWIEVRDSGVGLSEEKMKTIFTLSDCKSTSGTQGEKGTGLGLMLCADYVALNKGEIKVESKKGEGTVFRFSVPSFFPEELNKLKLLGIDVTNKV
jgi:signal transduction histidine kinase